MTGFTLGQEYGHGRTEQSQIVPGFGGYDPVVAGASYSFNLQRFDRWRLVFCTFTLATDDTDGDRYCTIEYPAGNGNSETADGASVTVSPSTDSQRFVGQFQRGPAEWNTGTDVFFPLCGIWLEAGRTITLNIANVGADDALSAVSFTFDRTPVEGDGTATQRLRDEAIREQFDTEGDGL